MSYFTTGYRVNSIDLANYFPTYESGYILTEPTAFNTYTVTLSRNNANSNNYVVFTSFRVSGGTASPRDVSIHLYKPIIYEKTSTNFKIYQRCGINFNTSGNPTLTARLWWLVIYLPSSTTSYISSINGYQVNGTTYNFATDYPQHSIRTVPITTGGSSNINISLNFSTKNFPGTGYICIDNCEYVGGTGYVSVEDTMVYIRPFLFYSLSASSTSISIYSYVSASVNVNLNTMIIYKQSQSAPNTTTNYNVVINGTSYDLSKIFPCCEYFQTGEIIDDDANKEFTFTLSRQTIDYIVIPSFLYSSSGTGGTYSPSVAAQSATYNLVIRTFTTTSFSVFFSKTTGNNWKGYVSCLVIYY